MENPFRYGGVVRGEYFADREFELEDLEKEMGFLYKSPDGRYRFSDAFMPHWIGYLRRDGS